MSPKPPPFRRPSISLSDNHDDRRTWRDIPASELRHGDVWAQHGRVTKIQPLGLVLQVWVGLLTEPVTVAPDTIIKAFTRRADG